MTGRAEEVLTEQFTPQNPRRWTTWLHQVRKKSGVPCYKHLRFRVSFILYTIKKIKTFLEVRIALQRLVNSCGNVRMLQCAEVIGFVLGQKPRQLFSSCIAHFWGLCVVAREAVNFKCRNLKDQVKFKKKKNEWYIYKMYSFHNK